MIRYIVISVPDAIFDGLKKQVMLACTLSFPLIKVKFTSVTKVLHTVVNMQCNYEYPVGCFLFQDYYMPVLSPKVS